MVDKHPTVRLCSQEGCDRIHHAKDFCGKHYKRFKKEKSLVDDTVPCITFLSEVSKLNTDNCIPWPFSIFSQTGYGAITFKGKLITAHRAMLIITTHANPPKLHACHNCRLKCCINPRHLRWDTRLGNMYDKVKDGTLSRGDKHGMVKLTNEQALSVYHDHRGCCAIASEHGIAPSTVCDIKAGRNWAWLTGHEHVTTE